MLLQKKETAPNKVYFVIDRCKSGWEIYVKKAEAHQEKTVPYIWEIPKPDIFISYTPEQEENPAEAAVRWDDSGVEMKASQFSYETRMLGVRLRGYNKDGRWVVSFQEEETSIVVALSGMDNVFEGELFDYSCSSESIVFQTKNQTVMEMYPAFIAGCLGAMQIKGWIYESHLRYLPYLSGLLGYANLT